MSNDIGKLLGVIKRIFEILDKGDRRKSYVVLADILLCAILETVGVSLIVPFINAISSPEKVREYPVIGGIVTATGISGMRL